MGNPTPYRTGTDTLVKSSDQRHTYRVQARYADGTVVDLQPLTCRVAFDEETAPRVTAEVEVAAPAATVLAQLDPRTSVRLRISAGYVWPDGYEDLRLLGDLGLVERAVRRPDNTLRLVAQSDEAAVIAAGHMHSGTITGTTHHDAIKQLVNGAFTTARTFATSGTAGGSVSLPVTDTDRWENVDDLADRINADVFDDGTRTWTIGPRTNTPASSPHHELSVGEGGTILTSAARIERQGSYANRVHTVYDWRDSSGVSQKVIGVGQVTSGAFAWSNGNSVILEVRRSVPTTLANANTAAGNIARRTVTRGRSHELTAVAAYWLRPGSTVMVTLPTGPPEPHLVAGVEFDLGNGSMDVRTRVADTTITIA